MAETEFRYDVLISYSHKDEGWADKVLRQRLDDAGLKVCIDYRDFEAGKMALFNMQDAAKQSKHIVLVLTRNWLNSEWSLFEAVMGGTIDPAGLQKKLIPLLCEDGIQKDINPFIAMRTWVDFTRKDREDIAWKQLFAALGKPEFFQPSNVKPETGSRDTWHLAHPYPMPPNFTGRATELKMLDGWLADNTNRLFILRALGGFGKSALAWQWINTHVNPTEWTKLVFWSFYEGDASFEHFIEETLKYLKLEVPQGQRPQVDALLKAMQSQKILLIMDGFERALRAYSSMNATYQGDETEESPSPASGRGARGEGGLDCVNINAEIFLKHLCSLPIIKSKVLMTTRLTPRAVKPRGEFMLGCREVELTSMQPADAVEFFHKQIIKGTHAEIEAACAPYGYHPLSLRLLAGRILKDFNNPADIIVAQKLKIDGNIIQQKHHVLEVSYNSLLPREQKLLSTIACFRSPVPLKTLQSIAENKDTLDHDLHDLVERGLLHFDEKNRKFDLHPIVRRYAYECLTAPERTGAHQHLVNYFDALPSPEKVNTLEDLAPVIELYHHTIKAGKSEEALNLFYDRFGKEVHFQFGNFELEIELLGSLFDDNEFKKSKLAKEIDIGYALNQLANAYSASGQPHRAIPLYEMSKNIYEGKVRNDINLAIGLGNMGHNAQLPVGALRDADHNLQRQIEVCEQNNLDKSRQPGIHYELGRVYCYMGKWRDTEAQLNIAESIKKDQAQAKGIIWSYRALYHLLMARADPRSKIFTLKSSIQFALYSLEFAKEDARQSYPTPRDFIRAHWLLGAGYVRSGELYQAEVNLSKAIHMCRQINMVDHESDILLDLARLRYDQNNYEEAKSLSEEALLITERCGYVLQGADVNLFLAQYALEQEKDKAKAKECAEEALKLATCDGPPYYYKVAYEEAERMLKKLG